MKHNDSFADLSANELKLKAENAMLKVQLEEKEETLRAIQCGEIDALVVQSQSGPQVYTLQGLDAELNRFRGEILERISEAIIVLNENHHIVYINAAAEKMYGIKCPAILGEPIYKLYQTQWLHPYDEAEMVTELNEKGRWNGESLHLKTNGEILHIEILVTRLPQNIRPCYGDILVIRDITERKKVEDRIRADAERLAYVLAAQREIAAAELDGPNLLQLILKTMTRITGADGASIEMLEGDMVICEAATGVAEPFIGLKLHTKDTLSKLCISSGKLQRVDDIENKLYVNFTFSRPIDIKSLVMIPLRYGKNLFGVLKLFSSRLKTFDYEAEKILKLMTEFLGAIIARQKIIKALTESETRLAVAVNATEIGISEFEIATGKMLWTEQFAKILGIKNTLNTAAISLVYSYSDWAKRVHPDDLSRVETEIHRCIEEKKPYEIEYRVIWDDGSIRWLAGQGILFGAAYGQPERVLIIIQDITNLKQEEKKLLEEDQRKNLFLATLAHELRNPLAPLSNGLHLLEDSGLNHATIDKVHKMMTRQLNHLVRLVDDLMEVSRVTRGIVNLRKERIDLTEVLLNAIETSQPLIKNGKHQLETNISSQPLILEGDKIRLTQIVTNILNNAAKYTLEGGHICLSAGRKGTDAIVSIRDNGLGIAVEAQPKIFDMFYQIKQSDDRAQGGLGIGLTLVKSLIDMHGGNVEIYSKGVNQGSEFILRLPLVNEIINLEKPDQEGSQLDNLSSHHILIVDDNKDAADSLALLLGQMVAEVRTVNDGAASIELLKTFKPSVILLDIGMPDMDGYEVARWVRQQPLSHDVKLIAMTGWGQEEDRRKSYEAGIDHHLVKPVDFGTLTKLLQLKENNAQ